MIPKNISRIMSILIKHYGSKRQPTVRRSARSKDPFRILISCLLSLRTKDENTEKVSKKLFEFATTPRQIAKMPIKKLEKLIFSSGHYRKKARILKHVSQVLIKKYKCEVPSQKSELLSIKGIGPKTANIVLCFAYNKCVIPVDVHCHRIPNRLGWLKTKTPEQTEKELEKILPKKHWRGYNTIMILFGKSICTPVSPFCSHCPIRRYCKRIGIVKSR